MARWYGQTLALVPCGLQRTGASILRAAFGDQGICGLHVGTPGLHLALTEAAVTSQVLPEPCHDQHPSAPCERGRAQGPPSPARRRLTWTRALWITLAAFGIWLLLDAPTLQHNAKVSPVGTRRTVSLDVLGRSPPSAAVSVCPTGLHRRRDHRPKRQQPGNGSAVLTEGPHHGSPTPTTARSSRRQQRARRSRLQSPTAAAPLRVLVVGDSLGIDLGTRS